MSTIFNNYQQFFASIRSIRFLQICPQRNSFPFVRFVFIKGSQIKRIKQIKQIFLPYSSNLFSTKSSTEEAEKAENSLLFVGFVFIKGSQIKRIKQIKRIFLPYSSNLFSTKSSTEKAEKAENSLLFVRFVFYKFVHRENRESRKFASIRFLKYNS